MIRLTKEWKQGLDEYERIIGMLLSKGYTSLEAYGKCLKDEAQRSLAEREEAEKYLGVENSVDDFLFDEIYSVCLEKRACLTFRKGIIYIDDCKVVKRELFDRLGGKAYLAAVELKPISRDRGELHCLFCQIMEGGRKSYFDLILSGKISVLFTAGE